MDRRAPTMTRVDPRPSPVAEVVTRLGDRVLDVRHLTAGRSVAAVARKIFGAVPGDRYVVGEGPAVQLAVAMPAGSERAGVALVRVHDGQISIALFPGLTGELRDGAEVVALEALVARGHSSCTLPPAASCEARLGGVHIHVRAVEAAALVRERRPIDRLYLASNVGALGLLAVVLAGGDAGRAEPLEREEVGRALAVRYLRELPSPPPRPERPVLRDMSGDRGPAPARPSVQAAAPRAVAPPARPGGSGPALHAPPLTRRGRPLALERAREAGVLGDGAFIKGTRVTGASAQEGLLHYDNAADAEVWAGLANTTSRPTAGLGLAGSERGGGVHGEAARPAVAGRKIAVDVYARQPAPGAGARALARRMVDVEFELPHVIGELSPRTVQEDLQAYRGDLVRCFKRSVGVADRVGTIFLRLELRGDGGMARARLDYSGSQLGAIEDCIVGAAKGWQFTPPIDRQPARIAVEANFSPRSY